MQVEQETKAVHLVRVLAFQQAMEPVVAGLVALENEHLIHQVEWEILYAQNVQLAHIALEAVVLVHHVHQDIIQVQGHLDAHTVTQANVAE